MDQALIKTSLFVSHPERSWDEAYGSLSGHHCEFLHPATNEGKLRFNPQIRLRNLEWEQNLDQISVLLDVRQNLSFKAKPMNDLELKNDFIFVTHSEERDEAIIQYVLDVKLIEKIRQLSLEKRPVHVFSILFSDPNQVDEGFWVDCEKAEFLNGKAIAKFNLETYYATALHVGRIIAVESYDIDEYQSLSGTDPVRNYISQMQDKFDLVEANLHSYEQIRERYSV